MAEQFPSLPPDFTTNIRQSFPIHAESLLHALDHTEPITAIRYNRRKCDRFHYTHSSQSSEQVIPIPWYRGGYQLSERPTFSHDPLWHAGGYYVQEAASMAVASIAPLLPSHPIDALDLCAAPGGKSTLLQSILPQGSTLVANEPVPKRAQILKENLLKWGDPYTLVTNNYPDQLQATGGQFDLIVVDAPCSGEGLFRKMPEARLEWSLRSVAECAERQRQILDVAWSMLRAGGILVYCTCTFNMQEDEEQARYLVDKYHARLLPISPQQEWQWIEGKEQLGWHFFPGITLGEGFYFVVLTKDDDEAMPLSVAPHKTKKGREDVRKMTPKPDISCLKWLSLDDLKEAEGKLLVSPNAPNEICWIPKRLQAQYELLCQSSAIRILSVGVPLSEKRGGDQMPSPYLPYSLLLRDEVFPSIDLNLKETLHYLAGDTLVPPQAGKRGICLIRYQKLPIGFVKNVGSRCNNLYPKAYRLKQKLAF